MIEYFIFGYIAVSIFGITLCIFETMKNRLLISRLDEATAKALKELKEDQEKQNPGGDGDDG